MIRTRDDAHGRRAPLVVASLIAVQVAAFAYEISLELGDPGAGALAEFLDVWGLVPREFLRGAAEPSATRQIVWLTPLTAMFLHAGLLHLAGNALYLWIFGGHLEACTGHGRFLALYLGCGLAAAALQLASHPGSYAAMLGSSGAVSGVLGAYVASGLPGRLRLLWPAVRLPAAVFLGLWIVIQIISAPGVLGEGQGSVAWWAHVGGFGAGVALGRSRWVRNPTRSGPRS